MFVDERNVLLTEGLLWLSDVGRHNLVFTFNVRLSLDLEGLTSLFKHRNRNQGAYTTKDLLCAAFG